jgi:hypothetical protein
MQHVPLIVAGVALVFAAAALVLAWQTRKISNPQRMDRLETLISEHAPSEILSRHQTELSRLNTQLDDLDRFARRMDGRLDTAVQRIGLTRFNMGEQVGGELSFALTMLDSRNHGLILTALTDHGGTRVFIRGVVRGQSQHPLMPYEERSLKQAMDSHSDDHTGA